MDWVDLDANESGGCFIMSYGESGKGQTVSTLKSAPRRVMCAYTEPRDVRRTCKGNVDLGEMVGEKKAFKIGNPTGFRDLKSFINEGAEILAANYKTFIVDTIDFFMNVELLGAIKKETFKDGTFKSDRELANELRTDPQGYAGLSSQMIEFCKTCKAMTARGMVVIFLAHETENPKWNMELKLGPSFAGKEFGKNFKGFFDLIGYVESRYDDDGKKIFPPLISFDEGNDRGYLAKWSGPRLDSYTMPLDWAEILKKGG